jgi:hypothetical protein
LIASARIKIFKEEPFRAQSDALAFSSISP